VYNEIIKEIFDERRIEIPFPHMTLVSDDNRQSLPEGKKKRTNGKSGRTNGVSGRTRAGLAKPERPAVIAKRLRAAKVAQDGPADEGDGALVEARI